MGLSAGIVGLPNVGKTTIFQAITLSTTGERSNYMFSTTEPVPGVVTVPDDRLPILGALVHTKKLVPAQMHVTDIPGLVSGSSSGEGMGIGFLGAIKESDALLHVVRCFDKEGVLHVSGTVDPAADAEIVEMELMQADLQTLKRSAERVAKKARAGDAESKLQLAAFEKAIAALDGGTLLRQITFTDAEKKLLYPLFLLTGKPVLFIANVGDDDLEGSGKHVQALREYAKKTGAQVSHICGDLEAEFVRMAEDERKQFMQDLGFKESGLARLIHRAFDLLGLQTYFTAGEKETRAWVIHKGDTAPVGAGVIHTDFVKKFVRAEIYRYEDIVALKTEKAIKDAGKMRLEGKDYVLQDGDVCNFLIAN
ncbi:MAG: redox-regulated ATPase YchF [Planctomycetes bacterium]|nr:redox-regulated ATPase YchF [Planctomycetota bacterium]